jgi:hypothetical protein
VGIFAIYQTIFEPKSTFEIYLYTIFLIGFVYGILDLYYLFSGNEIILKLGLGFPFIHSVILIILAGITEFDVLTVRGQYKYLIKNRGEESDRDYHGIIIVHYKNPLIEFGGIGVGILIDGFTRYRDLLEFKIPSKIRGLKGVEPYVIYNCYSRK